MTFAATVLTLYPEMFPGPLGVSLAGRALAEGTWSMDAVQIRDFAADKHRTVDDTPAGGGAGMVLRVDVLAKAVDFARGAILPFRGGAGGGGSPSGVALGDGPHPHPSPEGEGLSGQRPVIALTPRGKPLTQERVRELAAGPGVILLCGRFEGFDERIFEGRDVEEVSVGDIVLSGGECAALMLLDACIRLLPGVMGAALSGHEESFENGLLEYPHYTRPAEWEGRVIPEVLRSGDHAKIAEWRKRRSEDDTRLRRPDLWERHIGARVQSASGAQREVQDLKNEPDSAA
ncbi:tRNA (guanosine(37)-N1)-methyltransferase TrmD [Novosphingobium sp. CECT 9465]|uniref:tRNA (guanosine(37)-N1)-methyltransferase TrmD n=1 Tax=Novosphingobium sp. CECT 9465 TaxID=2829794 RepID=UPI001E29657F|nr:tRNA (guanosine(37)-N1)-methyltransferase TrmD [Novosphingobium sp. CECT 9465]